MGPTSNHSKPQPLQRPLLSNHHYHHHEVRCLPRLLPARPCHGHGQRQRRYSHGCGATATGLVASPGTDVTKTITITSTKTVEQNTNLRKGVVRITTTPTVIPTVVPTTTPVSFIGYADWTSAASSLTPFSFFAHLF